MPLLLLLYAALPFHASSQEASLRQKIGQMVMLGFTGSAMDDTLRADLATRDLGGVVLLGANCVSPAQIQTLTSSIRAASRIPPFIAIDQEGGRVARLNQRNGYAATATAYSLGTVLHAVDSTGRQAALMTSWLKDAGITTNLAPVADVNVNPLSPAIGFYGRSFSADPATVAAHVARFVDRSHEQRIITCLKHFPGHGSAGSDSHLTLPDITTTWADSELTPYRALLAAGRVDMVMVGHLYNAARDSLYPASLSSRTIQRLLRDSLHYQGVVISDDFYNMKAITDNFGFGETVELAVNAGTDILLYVADITNGSSLCRMIVDTLEARVRSGSITAARIDEAYDRIMQLKQRYLAPAAVEAPAVHASPAGNVSLASYPNPFNASTTIRYALPARSEVTMTLYTPLGQRVRTLASGPQETGQHEVRFHADDLASGVYFCRLEVISDRSPRPVVQTQRLLLIR